MNVPEAAYLLGRSVTYVRRMIQRGQLKGSTFRAPHRKTEMWTVDDADVTRLARRQDEQDG